MDIPSDLRRKYEILDQIRVGGMGAVYRARHRELNKLRVVKVINPEYGTDPEIRERFRREAQFASVLEHPNIAQVYDFSIEDGSAGIVMELITGLNLAELRRKGRLPLGLSLEIARQTLKALAYLHRQGFVHRDISPDNLMLTRDVDGQPLVKLIDLGIARALNTASRLTGKGVVWGKEFYASPEQLKTLSSVRAQSDLYSFGIVLYELLTHDYPFETQPPGWLRTLKEFAKTDPEGRIHPDLRAVLHRALAENPEERFQSAEEFSASIDPFRVRFPVVPGDLDRVLDPSYEAVSSSPTPIRSETTRAEAGPGVAPPPAKSLQTVPVSSDRDFRETEAPKPVEAKKAPQSAPLALPTPRTPPASSPVPIVPKPSIESGRPTRNERQPSRRSSGKLAYGGLGLLLVLLALFALQRPWDQELPLDESPVPEGNVASQQSKKPVETSTASAKISQPAPSQPSSAPSTPPRNEGGSSKDVQLQESAEAPPSPIPANLSSAKTEENEKELASQEQQRAGTNTRERSTRSQPPRVPPLPIKETRDEEDSRPGSGRMAGRRQAPQAPSPSALKEKEPEVSASVHSSPASPEKGPKAQSSRPGSTQQHNAIEIPVDLGGGSRPARILSKPTPSFPSEAYGRIDHATITVTVIIDEEGRVSNAYVERCSIGDRSFCGLFEEAALTAARKARFEPSLERGKPVEGWGTLDYVFGG